MTTATGHRRPPLPGVMVAGATAAISGVSVFVNSYGVKAFHQAAVYTTAKNLVAAVVLTAGAAAFARRRAAAAPPVSPRRPLSGAARGAALTYVGAVGGGLAFVLFFDGLAATSAVPAAFLRDSLVVWVALGALPFLGERPSRWNLAAIALLVAGQVSAGGGMGHLIANRGAALVLAATVLWAVEVLVARRLLDDLSPATVALTRMGGGAVVLVGYLAATGHLSGLVALSGRQFGWALATGALLAGYVATWMTALARARAVDVTSVLVGGALVTAALDALTGRGAVAPHAVGLAMVAVGAALVVRAWPRAVPAA